MASQGFCRDGFVKRASGEAIQWKALKQNYTRESRSWGLIAYNAH
jgi:hypothetical protein